MSFKGKQNVADPDRLVSVTQIGRQQLIEWNIPDTIFDKFIKLSYAKREEPGIFLTKKEISEANNKRTG